MAALYRWRPAWQADYAARLDWCTNPYQGANHAPYFKDVKRSEVRASAGTNVKLTAPMASDPDNDELRFDWFFYSEEGTYRGAFPTLTTDRGEASFITPAVGSQQTMHVILEVTDNGTPALTCYKRFIVFVEP
jgi:hypothetical protein